MYSQQFECPSCGGTLEKKTPGARSLVCPYCGQTSHLNANSLEAAGEKHMLIDYGSALKVGDTGTLEGRPYQILGRIRIDYEEGFWDEWYINYLNEDEAAWIQEDDGSFVHFAKIGELDELLPFDDIPVGHYINVGRLPDPIFITSKSRAYVNGGEGELPFQVIPGDPADFIEGILSGRIISVENLPNDTAIFMGHPLKLEQLGLNI